MPRTPVCPPTGTHIHVMPTLETQELPFVLFTKSPNLSLNIYTCRRKRRTAKTLLRARFVFFPVAFLEFHRHHHHLVLKSHLPKLLFASSIMLYIMYPLLCAIIGRQYRPFVVQARIHISFPEIKFLTQTKYRRPIHFRLFFPFEWKLSSNVRHHINLVGNFRKCMHQQIVNGIGHDFTNPSTIITKIQTNCIIQFSVFAHFFYIYFFCSVVGSGWLAVGVSRLGWFAN